MYKVLDPVTWYSERELSFTPLHFVVASTAITNESKLWILGNLKGRFSIIKDNTVQAVNRYHPNLLIFDSMEGVPAFEDPKEATMYELKWS